MLGKRASLTPGFVGTVINLTFLWYVQGKILIWIFYNSIIVLLRGKSLSHPLKLWEYESFRLLLDKGMKVLITWQKKKAMTQSFLFYFLSLKTLNWSNCGPLDTSFSIEIIDAVKHPEISFHDLRSLRGWNEKKGLEHVYDDFFKHKSLSRDRPQLIKRELDGLSLTRAKTTNSGFSDELVFHIELNFLYLNLL